jgi:hypothetical protein
LFNIHEINFISRYFDFVFVLILIRHHKMLSLFVRSPAMRIHTQASLQILKRTQSIAVHQRASQRQQQALIRGGLALVAIGGTGYLLNKVK